MDHASAQRAILALTWWPGIGGCRITTPPASAILNYLRQRR